MNCDQICDERREQDAIDFPQHDSHVNRWRIRKNTQAWKDNLIRLGLPVPEGF